MATWFEDPGSLLDELKRGEASRWARPTIPGYDELRELSRGGQGMVYTARQISTRRQVAIKVLFDGAEGSPSRRFRFEREIDLVSALRHPGIVRVYDSGVASDGRLFTVMEYIEGQTLDQHRTGSRDATLRLFVKICEAVHHAHQRGIIHRDLKPTNIIVDSEGQPHVVDFGIARQTFETRSSQDSATLTGQFLGTLAYASPEQVEARPDLLDVRTDVYSLGVLLYEGLCGRTLHDSSLSMAELIRAITERPIPATSLGDELDTVVRTALAKEPDRRYSSAEALGSDLASFLAGEPISAKRDSVAYVIGKLVRRHKLSVGLAATMLLMLVGGSAVLAVLYGRATREAEENQQVRIFLEDTLGSVEPTRLGSEVTVREELDEALHWVGLVLGDREEIAAALRTTIGNGYRNLGLHDRAEIQLEAALETRRKLFGDSHLDVAQSLNSLALLRVDQERFEEAEGLFRRALAMRKRLVGARSYEVSLSYNNLAGLARKQGRLDEAERLYEDSLSIRRAVRGNDHPDVAMCLFRLAGLAEVGGRLGEAVDYHRQALAARRARLHPDHPDLAHSLRALGLLLNRAGSGPEGESLLREAWVHRTRSLPPGHWRIAEAAIEVGEACLARGRLAEAEEPLTIAIQILDPQGPPAAELRRRAGEALARLRAAEPKSRTP